MTTKEELVYNPLDRKLTMPVNQETVTICPHCQSGFIILPIGIHDNYVTNLAVCVLSEVKIPLYCPYCGKDMTEVFRWESKL